MKKFLLPLIAAALLVASVTFFTACGREMPAPLETELPPETTPYVPGELNIEFFETVYTNMSPWKKYPSDTSSDTVSDAAEDSETPVDADTAAEG